MIQSLISIWDNKQTRQTFLYFSFMCIFTGLKKQSFIFPNWLAFLRKTSCTISVFLFRSLIDGIISSQWWNVIFPEGNPDLFKVVIILLIQLVWLRAMWICHAEGYGCDFTQGLNLTLLHGLSYSHTYFESYSLSFYSIQVSCAFSVWTSIRLWNLKWHVKRHRAESSWKWNFNPQVFFILCQVLMYWSRLST